MNRKKHTLIYKTVNCIQNNGFKQKSQQVTFHQWDYNLQGHFQIYVCKFDTEHDTLPDNPKQGMGHDNKPLAYPEHYFRTLTI